MNVALSKGEHVPLCQESGDRLHKICVGLNWGAIPQKNYFGMGKKYKAVDLDGSVAMFNAEKELLELVFYNNKVSADKGIIHSGDDLSGDRAEDDKLDNEVILINLDKIRPEVDQIFVMLNSYTKQNFGDIPYVKIRVYEGTPLRVDSIVAFFNLAKDRSYSDRISMLMAKMYRDKDESGKSIWQFETIGEPIEATDILEAVEVIGEDYL